MRRIAKRPTPRTARGAATRARIVDAAAALMRTRGVAGTSLDAVLEVSEASKSQLYHYFADKDELVLAVIQRQASRVLATHEARLRGVTSIAGLREWRDAVVASTRREHGAGGCPLGSLVSELAEEPRSRAVLADGFARWQALFLPALEAIRGEGDASDDDLADLATTLLAALQGGLLLAQTTRSMRPLELALDAAIDQAAVRLTESSGALAASTGRDGARRRRHR